MSYQIIDLKNKAELNKLISRIDAKLESVCRAYETANDEKISEATRKVFEYKRIRLMTEIEIELETYGIICDWPGLFPIYHSRGKETHNLRWALVGSLVE